MRDTQSIFEIFYQNRETVVRVESMSRGRMQKTIPITNKGLSTKKFHTHFILTGVGREILISLILKRIVGKIAVERGADRTKLDDVVIVRGRLRRYSVEKTGVDQLLQEKFDVAEFVVLDAEGFQHAEVTVLDRHEDRAEVFEIRPHQMQSRAKVFDGLRF